MVSFSPVKQVDIKDRWYDSMVGELGFAGGRVKDVRLP